MLVLALFGLVSVLLLVLLHVLRASYLEPSVVSLIMWMVSSGLILAGLIDYGTIPVLTPYSFAILIICIMAFVLGSLCHRRSARYVLRSDRAIAAIPDFPRVLRLPFILLPLIFAGLVFGSIRELFQGGPVTLEDLKQLHWERYYQGTYTPKQLVLAVTRPFAFLLAITAPLSLIRNLTTVPGRSLLLRVLPALSWIALMLEDLGKGKRAITILLLLATIGYFLMLKILADRKNANIGVLLGRIGLARVVPAIVAGIAVVYATFGVFPALKNPNLYASTVNRWLSYNNGGAVVNEGVIAAEERLGVPHLATFAYGTAYITSPIMRYTYFLQETDINEWQLMGTYNLPQFAKLAAYASNERSHFIETRERIEKISPYGKNPFKTGVTDFIIDFTVAGAVCVMFLWGWVSQKLFVRCLRAPTQELLVMYSLMLVGVFAFPLFSLWYLGPFSNTLMCGLGIYWWRRLAGSRTDNGSLPAGGW